MSLKSWVRSTLLVALVLLAGMALVLATLACRPSTRTPEITPATPTPTLNPTEIALLTPTPPGRATPAAPTPTSSPTPCGSPPAGWVAYTVQPGDTLSELALLAGVTQEQVIQVNCLAAPELMAGQVLFLPPLPTPTPCGTVPAGWEPYTVQAGDTLFGLASRAGVSQEQVMQVNCLASEGLMAGEVIYLPPLPTPSATPCEPSPPEGWVLYTVRLGDTMFSLAVTRGTTTEEVIRVNCLTSSDLWEGDTLYLPPLLVPVEPPPGPTAPFVPPGGGEGVAELPPWELEIGSPGAGQVFKACQQLAYGVDMLAPPLPRPASTYLENVELGERRYFFACGLALPLAGASVTFPDGRTESVPLLDTLPSLDLDMDNAQAVIDWPVLPDHPLGIYTVTITDSNLHPEFTEFQVMPPTEEHILAVRSHRPGVATFDVYYVHFSLGSRPKFEFYREDYTQGKAYELAKRDEWSVLIDESLAGMSGKGWGQEALSVQTTGLPAALAIAYNERRTFALFWLLQP